MNDTGTQVLVVGGGVAGTTAATFTARAGLTTLVADGGESILARNAHLENYPGFPGGIDARLFLEMAREQATDAGAEFDPVRVVDLERTGDGFVASVEDADGDEEGGQGETPTRTVTADQVIAASWSDASYLDGIAGVEIERRGSKPAVQVDDRARTDVEDLYAAGRIADQYHQTVVSAGHGATAGLSAVHDSPVDYYHDWVTPERYFTGRDRPIPPGCEEIDDEERRRREEAARERLRERIEEPHDDEPTMHPSVDEE